MTRTKKAFLKILWVLARIAADFAIFWGIFLWEGGLVWESLKSVGPNSGEGWFQRLWLWLGGLVSGIWSLLGGLLGGVWEVLGNLFGAVWEMLCGFFGAIWSSLTGIWGWISDGFSGSGSSEQGMLRNLWEHIVFLTPYGREAAMDPDFLYCLHWCSGCVVLFALLSYSLSQDEFYAGVIPGLVTTFAASVALWYVGYGVSFLLVQIPVLFTILAPVAMVITCVVAGFVLLLVESFIWE